MSIAPLGAVLVCVLIASVLACVDEALGKMSTARIDDLRSQGRAGAERLSVLMRDSARSVSLLLLLRLLAETTAVAIATAYALAHRDEGSSVVLVIAVMTLVGFMVIGVAPRTLGRQHADRVALASAVPVSMLTSLFGPLPRLLIVLGNALTPGRGFREGPFASEAELRDLVELAQERGLVEQSERDMIESVFDLGDTFVREVMVPRTDIVVIERNKTVKQALNLMLRSGFSRVPVVGENTDEVVGVAHLKDLVKRERSEGGAAVKVEEVSRSASFVPESKPVDELLREMRSQLGHLAIVVDEYGGTAGLVTLEDLIEEVVGEITDEHDREAPPIEHLADGGLRVTARLPVEDLEELMSVELPHEDVDSVGGLLSSALGRVPIPGATVTVGGLVLVAESAKGRRNRIGTVLVRRTDEDQT